jgi:hypothetical protein
MKMKWAATKFWARFKHAVVELISEFWFKEMGFKIKWFQYFRTEFDLDSNKIKSNKLFDDFSNLEIWDLV